MLTLIWNLCLAVDFLFYLKQTEHKKSYCLHDKLATAFVQFVNDFGTKLYFYDERCTNDQ